MTMPARYTKKLNSRLPSQDERDAATQLSQLLAAHARPDGSACLNIVRPADEPEEVVLTPDLLQHVIDLLSHIGEGDAVNIVPIAQMLTTQQAADVLNVPHPYVLSLLKTGALDYTSVGRHRRVKAEAIFEFKHARDTARSSALDNLASIDTDYI